MGRRLDIAAVVCAAPFGYENICAHRSLRILADELAGGGIAALRFDFPGTGDSDGEQRLPAWKAAVADAVATLRRETGCTRIAIIGVGLSGTITLASLDGGLNIDKLILWGSIEGRAWLRQQRAYHRVTAIKPSQDEPPSPPTPEGLEEFSGFPMTAVLAEELTALDVAAGAGRRVAVEPAPARCPGALAHGRRNEELPRCGPERARHPIRHGKLRRIRPDVRRAAPVDRAQGGDRAHARLAGPGRSWPCRLRARQRDECQRKDSNREGWPHRGDCAIQPGNGGLLFSIETRPVGRAPEPTWCVWLTGRAVRHVGPNRIWVRFAREIAARGFASLRLDGRSVGDSEGEGNTA